MTSFESHRAKRDRYHLRSIWRTLNFPYNRFFSIVSFYAMSIIILPHVIYMAKNF